MKRFGDPVYNTKIDSICVNCCHKTASSENIFCEICAPILDDEKDCLLFEKLYHTSIPRLQKDKTYRSEFMENQRFLPKYRYTHSLRYTTKSERNVSTWTKRIEDNICKNEWILAFLTLCFAKELETGRNMTEEEMETLYIEMNA